MAEIRVHEIHAADEGTWAFRDSGLTWRPGNRYAAQVTFDPFPAYAHDAAAVRRAAAHVQGCFAPLWDVDCYIADREEVSRSNGHSNHHADGHYEGSAWVKDTPAGMIVMSGKRIPPHPAVTRHLLAHEYGHNVEWMIVHARGAGNLHDDRVVREYARLRGLPEASLHHGEGGSWHDSATEIFACDFRILVCDVETEFWPHPGIERPEHIAGLRDWWTAAAAEVAATSEKAEAA